MGDSGNQAGAAPAGLTAVRKCYGAAVALDGLDLSVRSGELLAVLGPNGAGKSTAISMLLGLQRPDSGEALLFGRSPCDIDARRGVGVMMQEVVLPAELKVRELIDMTRAYYPAPLTLSATVALAGVDGIAGRPYGKPSGGQKRQAQFALAVCGRPRLLFLDEPTTGLDIDARKTLWAALRSLVADRVTIVLTTHYIEEAEALADRVVLLTKGRCIAEGAVAEMRALVRRKRIDCASSLALDTVRGWPEVETASRDGHTLSIGTPAAEAVVRRLLAADPDLADLEVRRAGLSEAFAELTRESAP